MTRCPYLAVPASDFSLDHIVPHALGGSADFALNVSRNANNQLGTMIESPLANSPLINALRVQHGIKSRSGEPRWKMPGVFRKSRMPCEITLHHDGRMEIHSPPRVNRSRTDAYSITLRADQRDAFQKDFEAALARRGQVPQLIRSSVLPDDEIEVSLSIDIAAIKRGMVKIAMGAAILTLGIDWIDDPVAAEFRRVVFESRENDDEIPQLRGLLDSSLQLPGLFPPLASHEHAVVIGHFGLAGPIAAVALFGGGMHTMLAILSDTADFGLQPGGGTVYVVDAVQRKTRQLSVEDVLIEAAREVFGPGVE